MKHFLLFFFVLVVSNTFSQTARVAGFLRDKSDNSPVIGATVFIKNEKLSRGFSSNLKGVFRFDSIPYGSYTVQITSIGYKKVEKSIVVDKPRYFLKKIEMEESVIQLESVKVEDVNPLAVQKGDTTEYSSDAYKTNQDATTGDLINKMPGITTKNGQVQAQGETVKQVLVDGKPYFGEDPKSALSNIPAQVVKKIQVFDDDSEESKSTGFKDGNTIKTINIITKPQYRNSKFGNVYAGYGTDKRYNAGGNYNIFNGDQRISLVGLFNNVNQQNFSSEDLVGIASGPSKRGYRSRGSVSQNTGSFLVSQQNGIAKTGAGGINYQDEWGKKTEVLGSYFYNNTKNDALENTLKTYFGRSDVNQLYKEVDSSFTDNSNRKFSFQVKHKFSKSDVLTFKTNLGLQTNFGDNFTDGLTAIGNDSISQLSRKYNSELLGYNANSRIFFNHRFKKRGRSAFVMFTNSINGNDGVSNLYSSEIDFVSPLDSLNQETRLLTKTISNSGRVRYTEPLGKSGGFMLDVKLEREKGESDNKTFDYSEVNQEYSMLSSLYSSEFNSDIFTQSYSIGYRFFSKKIFTFIRAQFKLTDLKTNTRLPVSESTNNRYQNILPFAMLKYSFSKSKYLFAMFRRNTSNPSVNQLQSFLDNSNPIQLQIGNSSLEQGVNNWVGLRFVHSNIKKSTIFYAMANVTFSDNYIGSTSDFYRSDTTINGVALQKGKILNSYENLTGYKSLRTFVSYGMPVKVLKSNLNLDGGLTFTKTPSKVNSEKNITDNLLYELGVVLSSNISEKIDFTLSGRATLNDVKNSSRTLNTSFLTQDYAAKIVVTFPKDIILRTKATYQLNLGFSDGLGVNYLMCNVGLAKKVFKNKKGEISINVMDVLDQNNRIAVTSNETFVEQLNSRSLQRYALLTFKYTFSKFKRPKEVDPLRKFRHR